MNSHRILQRTRAPWPMLVAGALIAGCSTFSPAPYDTPQYYLDEYGMVFGPDESDGNAFGRSPRFSVIAGSGTIWADGSYAGRYGPGFYPGRVGGSGMLWLTPYPFYQPVPALPTPVTATPPGQIPSPPPAIPVASPAPPTSIVNPSRPVPDVDTEPGNRAAPFWRGRRDATGRIPRARPRPVSPTPRSRPAAPRPAPSRTPPPGRPRVIDP